MAAVLSAIGFDADWHHFVGCVGDMPVATASLPLTSSVGGIYFVCTHPEHRRRGHGAAITKHAMSRAAQHGASHAVLGSSPMGQGVYERLGFRTIFSYQLMEWVPEWKVDTTSPTRRCDDESDGRSRTTGERVHSPMHPAERARRRTARQV